MSKFYFYNEDDEFTTDLEGVKDMMADDKLKEREVFEAKRMTGEGIFWCKVHYEVGEVGEGCGKSCDEYKPRNGKSGRCVHSGYCYTPAKKVLIKL